MANSYLVIPSMNTEVNRNSVVVEWEHEFYVHGFELVPVILRYEFTRQQQQQQAEGQNMVATITQVLKPEYRNSIQYTQANKKEQDALARATGYKVVYENFSDLEVEMTYETIHDNSVNNNPVATLCFVSSENQNLSHFPIKIIERTEWWNQFPINILEDMQRNLKTTFNIDLRVFCFDE
jgi:hypothetical protein